MKTEKLWNKKDIERIIDEHIDHLKKEGRVKTEEFEGVPRQPFTDKKITKHFAKQKFNLSDKIFALSNLKVVHVVDIKEFIRRLKKEVLGKQGLLEKDYNEIIDGLNQILGEKLV